MSKSDRPLASGKASTATRQAPAPSTKAPSTKAPSAKASPAKVSSLGRARRPNTGRPTALEAEALRDKILQASWDLLLEVGFERFSIDRLARSARIGKPTIYARFANKEGLLRAVLMMRVEQRHRDIFASAADRPAAEAIPQLGADAVEFFQSPEGRLVDRLIDWLDLEVESEEPSLRGWAVSNAMANAQCLMVQSNRRGETRIGDVATAAQFLVEGIAGHARLAGDCASFDRALHLAWAHRFWTMINDSFTH